ncbi:MAG: ribulose-phosphate 3-epimerase [Holosporales bacterium]|jgi:ribulose-phosphate 3-epimerase|nr:ribulose-phosphate 3-epimerase [Holosporales bacterium]
MKGYIYKNVALSASILAAETSRFDQDILEAISAGIDSLHIDVMDGCFVSCTSFSPDIVTKIRQIASLDLHVHLMVEDPRQYASVLAKNGANLVSFHIEAMVDPSEMIQHIKALGMKAGLAINPETSINAVKAYLPLVDQLLIMGVRPGFGGQSFISKMLDKISAARDMAKKYEIDVAVDGGVSPSTAKEIAAKGANVLIAGTAIFAAKDKAASIRELLSAARGMEC